MGDTVETIPTLSAVLSSLAKVIKTMNRLPREAGEPILYSHPTKLSEISTNIGIANLNVESNNIKKLFIAASLNELLSFYSDVTDFVNDIASEPLEVEPFDGLTFSSDEEPENMNVSENNLPPGADPLQVAALENFNQRTIHIIQIVVNLDRLRTQMRIFKSNVEMHLNTIYEEPLSPQLSVQYVICDAKIENFSTTFFRLNNLNFYLEPLIKFNKRELRRRFGIAVDNYFKPKFDSTKEVLVDHLSVDYELSKFWRMMWLKMKMVSHNFCAELHPCSRCRNGFPDSQIALMDICTHYVCIPCAKEIVAIGSPL